MSQKKGQDPRHPPSTYEAKYPYNRATVTESGHEIHYDDTPGKERIRVAHKSGSYEETSPDGKKVSQVVGNKLEYVKGGYTQTVDKNSDVKVHGSSRTNVSGDSHSEIKGSQSGTVGGHSKQIVGGDSVSAVNGDMVQGVRGSHSMRVGGGSKYKSDGDRHEIYDGKCEVEVGKNYRLYAKENIEIESVTNIKLKVGNSYIEIGPNFVQIFSETVYISKRVFSGYDSPKEETPPLKVVTLGGPAKQHWSKVE